MMLPFILFAALCGLLWLGYEITGAILATLIWLFIKLPCMLFLWLVAIACCCTLILIPVGKRLFTTGKEFVSS